MTVLPAALYISDNARTEGEGKQALEDIIAVIRQNLGGDPVTTLTIATGSATPTRGAHDVDTEAGAATDDLTNLAQTNHPDGSIIVISSVADARNVVVKHLAGGTGQISLASGADLTLDRASQRLILQRRSTNWVEIARSDAAGPAYALSNIVRYTTGSATYTKPATVRAIRVRMKAGGGGGGGAKAQETGTDGIAAAGAGGGAEGQTVEAFITAPAASYAYAVGAGGAGGAATPANGGTGGDTTFGTLTAKGGLGGKLATETVSTQERFDVGAGGAGVLAANATAYLNRPGAAGHAGAAGDGSSDVALFIDKAIGGAGGGQGGGEASVQATASAATAGTAAASNTGAGGSGAAALSNNLDNNTAAGGGGAAGDIVVEEYV